MFCASTGLFSTGINFKLIFEGYELIIGLRLEVGLGEGKDWW